jgi:hypothetical protein
VLILADEVTLSPKAEVVGVIVEGEPRAYFLTKMSAMVKHVVNDRARTTVGATFPFTVTYCDQTDCVRVLTPAEQSFEETTGIGTLGMLDGGLALQWNNQQFKQLDPIPGFKDLPYERMTWGEWLSKHPETKAYVGNNLSDDPMHATPPSTP